MDAPLFPTPDAASVATAPKHKHPVVPPQKALDDHWAKFITKTPGKITRIFPPSLYANLLPKTFPQALTGNVSATASYEAAVEACKRKVQRTVRECRRTNEKWSDPDFDIESDFGRGNCLRSLVSDDDDDGGDDSNKTSGQNITSDDLQDALRTLSSVPSVFSALQQVSIPDLLGVLQNGRGAYMAAPGSVHRVDWIYDAPAFTVNGFEASDVRQGRTGDCWWVAAVATLCSRPGAMDRVCVARDAACGVYGFVFHRDGAWWPVVVDDNLYVTQPDFDVVSRAATAASPYDAEGREAKRYRERNQTGSEALQFAQCADDNETWLPLLEKAYAKAHGDYAAIEYGFPGEGVEDLTGGVTTQVDTNKVLDKDRLWAELVDPQSEFIFATATPWSAGSGLTYDHAYSVLTAVEEEDENGKKVRLVKLRNPWGKRDVLGEGEWNGPWSDGSKEWNAYWLNKLNHKFGDDGVFWITLDDLLTRFDTLDRTRLFGEGWRVAQEWTSINVSWITGYINTKFVVKITKAGLFVFVLSKLDDRYFKGLEGQYEFELHFVLQEAGSEVGDHIARVRPSKAKHLLRGISAEIELDPGKYEVIPKILATRDDDKNPVEVVVRKWAEKNPQKIRQIGLNYDFSHTKAVTPQPAEKKGSEGKKKQEQVAAKVDPEKASEGAAEPEPSAEPSAETTKEPSAKPAEKESPGPPDPSPEPTREESSAESSQGEPEKKLEETAQQGSSAETAKEEGSVEKSEDVSKPEPTAESVKEEQAPSPEGTDSAKADENSQKASDPQIQQLEELQAAEGAAAEPTKAPETTPDKESPEIKLAALSVTDPTKTTAKGTKEPAISPEAKTAPHAEPKALGSTVPGPVPLPVPVPKKPEVPTAEAPVPDPKPEEMKGEDDEDGNPWNAVCVIGLRVYGKDEGMTIKLERPTNAEEGAALDLDGDAPGGTM